MKKSLLLIITLTMSVLMCLSSCKTDAHKPETKPTIKGEISIYGLSDFIISCSKRYGKTYELYSISGYTDYKWYINGEKLDKTVSSFDYTFKEAGVYEVLGTAVKDNILYSDILYIKIE